MIESAWLAGSIRACTRQPGRVQAALAPSAASHTARRMPHRSAVLVNASGRNQAVLSARRGAAGRLPISRPMRLTNSPMAAWAWGSSMAC